MVTSGTARLPSVPGQAGNGSRSKHAAKHTDLLCGEIPLGVEEVILVLGEDGHVILLHNGGIWALLDHLQVDGVGLIWQGSGERSVRTETSAPAGAHDCQPWTCHPA